MKEGKRKTCTADKEEEEDEEFFIFRAAANKTRAARGCENCQCTKGATSTSLR